MPIKSCHICTKQFYSRPSFFKKGWGRYCSIHCKSEAQKRGKEKLCDTCGKKIYRVKSKLTRASVSKKFFCNKSCFAIWKNKTMFKWEKHPQWKHGRSSYRTMMIRRNKKKIQCTHCAFNDIRALLVHHKDKNRKNNTLKNLLWLCHNCHYLIHDGKTI